MGLTLGLIQPSVAVTWADNCIQELDKPPYWLIELAMERGHSVYDVLKWIPEEFLGQSPTDVQFLGAMAVRFLDRQEPLAEVLALLRERFCFCEWTEMTDLRQKVYIIDDEFDWDPERAHKTATEVLREYLPDGRALISS